MTPNEQKIIIENVTMIKPAYDSDIMVLSIPNDIITLSDSDDEKNSFGLSDTIKDGDKYKQQLNKNTQCQEDLIEHQESLDKINEQMQVIHQGTIQQTESEMSDSSLHYYKTHGYELKMQKIAEDDRAERQRLREARNQNVKIQTEGVPSKTKLPFIDSSDEEGDMEKQVVVKSRSNQKRKSNEQENVRITRKKAKVLNLVEFSEEIGGGGYA